MTMGPEPMIRMVERSVRLGMETQKAAVRRRAVPGQICSNLGPPADLTSRVRRRVGPLPACRRFHASYRELAMNMILSLGLPLVTLAIWTGGCTTPANSMYDDSALSMVRDREVAPLTESLFPGDQAV